MPIIGWRIGDRLYRFEEALEEARSQGHLHGFPLPVLEALANRDEREPGIRISPSLLGLCPRKRVLEELEEFYVDLEHEWAPSIGRAVHEWIENRTSGSSELLLEDEIEVSGVPLLLRGRVDYYDRDTRTVIDFKTVSEFRYWDAEKRRRIQRQLPEPSHTFQINAYAYLLRRHGYPVDRAFLWYVRLHGSATRRLVEAELWDEETFYYRLIEAAEPIAEFVRSGRLPDPKEGPWCTRCPVQKICFERRGGRAPNSAP